VVKKLLSVDEMVHENNSESENFFCQFFLAKNEEYLYTSCTLNLIENTGNFVSENF